MVSLGAIEPAAKALVNACDLERITKATSRSNESKAKLLVAQGSGAEAVPATSSQGASKKAQKRKARRARKAFGVQQSIVGIALLLSAVMGAYLLATDQSLWILAVSHAVGLIIIVILDAALGLLSLSSSKRAFLPSMAAALLGFLLQVGDILTAPQYNMTIRYFAAYLFGLWAFDILLALQVSVLIIGLASRPYAQYLARRKSLLDKGLNYSRRSFVRVMVTFAGLIGVGVLLGSVKLPAPTSPSTPVVTTPSGGPQGAIAKVGDVQAGAPVYFEYPSGYPNILMKNTDGSLTAVSMMCTHVCCQCLYDGNSNQIYCPCHGSVFDKNGKVLRGPASVSLPQIELSIDTQGNVFPVKVTGLSPCLP